IVVVGGSYIVWDIIVTSWGEWGFNPAYLSGLYVINLPIEEILFFVTVPYACLFIYEGLLYTTEHRTFRIPRPLLGVAIASLVILGLVFFNQGYTMKAFLSCALFLSLMAMLNMALIEDRQYWLWLAICYIPFLIFNMVLTALPVVQYNPAAIFGVRFITIPLEDFFYNFSMLSFYLFVYVLAKRVLGVKD
ncbi:MAG: lycopene cyclase domain-containing protein, partial [Deltaproteobacteria bacterium]|nr:lycopene cyclase domain-containing protein [Deltaproteobacteria bacterium]